MKQHILTEKFPNFFTKIKGQGVKDDKKSETKQLMIDAHHEA